MKFFKLITALVLLILTSALIGQVAVTDDILYDYELIPTGNILNGDDTAYYFVLVLDTTDIKKLDKVTLSNELTKKDILVKTKDLKVSPKIKIKEDKYKLDMDEWYLQSRWEVTAEKVDGSIVKLKNRQKHLAVIHKIIKVQPERRNVKLDDQEPVIEPMPVLKPDPVEIDTMLNRTNQF